MNKICIFSLIFFTFINSFLFSMNKECLPANLHYSCFSVDFEDIEKLVLDSRRFYHDFDINSLDNFGQTALFWALQRPSGADYRLVQFLIKKGINVDTIDCFGRTPLFYCLNNSRFNFNIFYCLLEKGGDISSDISLLKFVKKWISYRDERDNSILYYIEEFSCKNLINLIKMFVDQENREKLFIEQKNIERLFIEWQKSERPLGFYKEIFDLGPCSVM